MKGNDFPTAALKLAFGQQLSDPKNLKDEVVKAAKEAPLTYLMGAAIVDSQGRTTAKKEGLFNLKGEAEEVALEAEAFSHATRFHWPLRVDGGGKDGRCWPSYLLAHQRSASFSGPTTRGGHGKHPTRENRA